MHPLLIAYSIDPVSGYGTMADCHCRALLEKNIPFTLLLPRSAKRVAVPYASNIRYILPLLPFTFNSFYDVARLPLLYAPISLAGISPTIVHSLVDFPYASLGFRIARKRHLPFIFSAVGTYSVAPFGNWIDKRLFMPAYMNATRILAISYFTAQAMQEAAGYSRSVDVLYSPAAEPKRPVSPLPTFPELPVSARVILSIGPLKERKGMDILIRALPHVLKVVPAAHIVIVAAYGDVQKYDALARSCGVSGHLSIMDAVTTEKLFFLFERSEVFAMTPRRIGDEFEGYGLVYTEAGWHAKPVIASRSGGAPEAVIDGKTGILVPENDELKTARALIAVLQDGAYAARLGRGGYDLALSRCIAAYAGAVVRLYGSQGNK